MARRKIDTVVTYTIPEQYTEQEVEDLCCEAVEDMPICAKEGTKIEKWSPGDIKDHWPASTLALIEQAKTDTSVRVSYAHRKNPCGLIETEYVHDGTCCDQPAPTFQFTQTPGKVDYNVSYAICVSGGTPPYSWSSPSAGLTIAGSGSCERLYVSDCFCEEGFVTVTDACNRGIQLTIESNYGTWVRIGTIEDDYHFVTPYGTQAYEGTGMWDPRDYGYFYSGQTVANIRYEELNPSNSLLVNGRYAVGGPFGIYGEYYSRAYTTSNTWGWGHCVESAVPHLMLVEAEYGLQLPVVSLPNQTRSPGGSICTGYNQGTFYKVHFWVGHIYYWRWECTNEPEEIIYDDENSVSVLADNTQGYISWEGGRAPYIVSLYGQGFYVDYTKTYTETTTQITTHQVYTGNACGLCEVRITDACGNVTVGSIKSTTGEVKGDCWALLLIYVLPDEFTTGHPFLPGRPEYCNIPDAGAGAEVNAPSNYVQAIQYRYNTTTDTWVSVLGIFNLTATISSIGNLLNTVTCPISINDTSGFPNPPTPDCSCTSGEPCLYQC